MNENSKDLLEIQNSEIGTGRGGLGRVPMMSDDEDAYKKRIFVQGCFLHNLRAFDINLLPFRFFFSRTFLLLIHSAWSYKALTNTGACIKVQCADQGSDV
jgi:hypothetical protein